MKKSISMFLLLILLLCNLCGCNDHLSIPKTVDEYDSQIIGWQMGKCIRQDQYIFTDWGRGAYYNMATGEYISNFCEDPECDGMCWLEMGITTINQVSDDRVYFTQLEAGTHDLHYCYRDMISGEIHIILSLPEEETSVQSAAYIDGDMMYFPRILLKEGGNPDVLSDYLHYLCSVPVEGGECKVVYEMRGAAEHIALVVEGVLYTTFESSLWRTDLATGEQKALFNSVENGYVAGFGGFQYLRGNLYFLVNYASGGVSFADGSKLTNNKRVILLDTATGIWRELLDIPVTSYCLTNDAIYICPTEPHQLSDPEIYTPTTEGVKYLSASVTLYECKPDGSELHPIWTDESGALDFCETYTVSDGVLYGMLWEFDQKNNRWGDAFFGEIHLDTGEVIPATVIE